MPQAKKSSGRSILVDSARSLEMSLHWDTFLGQVLTLEFGGLDW